MGSELPRRILYTDVSSVFHALAFFHLFECVHINRAFDDLLSTVRGSAIVGSNKGA